MILSLLGTCNLSGMFSPGKNTLQMQCLVFRHGREKTEGEGEGEEKGMSKR